MAIPSLLATVAYISVRPPTRPINIKTIIIILLATLKVGVRDRESPTVAKAEVVSKREVRKGISSMALKARALPRERKR